MKGFIGEFEELVLLTIATLGSEAYGVSILQDINERTNRNISIGALHSTITRLEEKGYITSELGGATNKRGGRRKRFFSLNQSAVKALSNMKSLRDDLWNLSDLSLIRNGE